MNKLNTSMTVGATNLINTIRKEMTKEPRHMLCHKGLIIFKCLYKKRTSK